MFDIRIAHLNYYVPENCVAIGDLLESVTDSQIPSVFGGREAYASFIVNDLQVKSVRIEDKLEDKEMLTNTVEKIFVDGAAEPGEIDVIILAQEEDQRQTLNLGQYIQDEFGLENAYVITLSGNHCANIDHALTIASQISNKNNDINNVLILGNVKVTNTVDRLVGTYGIVSDGSGSILLRKDGKGPGFVNSRILSAGRFHEVDLNRDNSLILLKYYVRSLKELLQRSKIDPAEISHIITQNANPLLVNQCLEIAGLDTDKIFIQNQTRYSHLDCLDFLVNLKDLMTQMDNSKEEGLILSFGTGWAGSFISSILAYNN